MNKNFLTIFALMAVCVTSAIGQTTLSGTALSNANDPNGDLITSGGLLGIFVVDSDDNGFSGATQGGITAGQVLSVGAGFGSNDDIIVGSNSYGEVIPNASYTLGAGFTFDYNTVSQNNSFGVYLITDTAITSTSDVMEAGSSYGFGRVSSGTSEWIVPPNQSGGTINFSSSPSDSEIQTLVGGTFGNLTAIPEPSAYATIFGLLGLGYAVFCRRRRSSSTD